MRRWILRAAAVALAVVATAGVSSAQAPVIVESAPAAGYPVGVTQASGCSTCGGGSSSKGYGAFRIGEGCQNTPSCGNWCTERTFLFGGCKQFFTPGQDCTGCGPFGGKHGHGGHGCVSPIFGTGPANPFNPCCYDSYLNH